MLADRSPGYLEGASDLASREFVTSDQSQDGAAAWLGKRAKRLVGHGVRRVMPGACAHAWLPPPERASPAFALTNVSCC
jgi:hypothetical protein